ncbi:MAG: TonB C-terminal domain-containing protein [Acidobacteriota bacterium]
MSVAQTTTTIVDRPLSLFEAFVLALASHTVIFLILFFLGLLAMLSERPVERNPDPDLEVRFTMAPESAPDEEGESKDSLPSDLAGALPAEPLPASEPETASPDPSARASFDEPQPRVAPQSGRSAAPSFPAVQAETEADSDEPPSDGLLEGVEQGDIPADTLSPGEDRIETELVRPETDDGGFARVEALDAQSPAEPALGRPFGPSIDERISDFRRAGRRLGETVLLQPAQAPRNVFEPDWSSLPSTGQALGNMVFESGDYDWTEYQRQIYWIIWRAWHSRLLARVDDFEKWAQQNETWYLDHINAVRFTIESNGEISSIVLETESGSVPLDLTAVEGLDESVLPPLPDDFPRDRETVHAQFIGHGPIASMRRNLRAYRTAGWF